jgi:hypothetical protein
MRSIVSGTPNTRSRIVSYITTPSPTSCSRSLSALTTTTRLPLPRAQRTSDAITSSASMPLCPSCGNRNASTTDWMRTTCWCRSGGVSLRFDLYSA